MNNAAAAAETLRRLPRFSAVDTSTLVADLEELLADHRQRIAALTADPAEATWDSVVVPMEIMAAELHRFFSPVSHLHNVADDDDLREPYNACIGAISLYASELAQNSGLSACYKTIREDPAFDSWPPARRQLINNALRDFRLGGVDLPATEQAAVRELNQELAQLQTRFEENLLDATRAFALNITDAARLDGLPETALVLAQQAAADRGEDGHTLTLDLPSYVPAMSHLRDRELRRTLYEAYVTRASDVGPNAGTFDNSEVMAGIVSKRQALARALGFANYAELSLATKMAPSADEVLRFLHELAERARAAATRELRDIEVFATETLGLEAIEAWDLTFAAEQYKAAHFEFSPEDLRPYFPVPRVIEGLFDVTASLFGIRFESVGENVDTWHADVSFYAVLDGDGTTLGYFYLDLYARSNKRSGAWMDECLVRWQDNDVLQLPVAYLNCNFTPSVGGRPSLLTHDEVMTLFHEFGHGLHHLLTRIDRPAVAGINGVPWDAVELPSQFLENWCWERAALDRIARHVDTDEAIPDDLYQRLQGQRTFQAAMQTLRQIEFALFDFRLHLEYTEGMSIAGLLDDVRQRVAVVQPPAWNRFQHSFAHIFAGGYAAGYYSYKWAEVLAADAFSRFEEEGIFNDATGQDFRRTILEKGGSEDAMDLFRAFRGRDPSVDPLLRQAGLIE